MQHTPDMNKDFVRFLFSFFKFKLCEWVHDMTSRELEKPMHGLIVCVNVTKKTIIVLRSESEVFRQWIVDLAFFIHNLTICSFFLLSFADSLGLFRKGCFASYIIEMWGEKLFDVFFCDLFGDYELLKGGNGHK